jgi:hypothetical protein
MSADLGFSSFSISLVFSFSPGRFSSRVHFPFYLSLSTIGRGRGRRRGASLQSAWTRRCSRPRARMAQPDWRALMLRRAEPEEAVAGLSRRRPWRVGARWVEQPGTTRCERRLQVRGVGDGRVGGRSWRSPWQPELAVATWPVCTRGESRKWPREPWQPEVAAAGGSRGDAGKGARRRWSSCARRGRGRRCSQQAGRG